MSEFSPIEDYFGEGIARPIRLVKSIGRYLLSLHLPYGGYESNHRVPFEDTYEPLQAVFNKEQYLSHLDDIEGRSDGLEL